jgi:transcriptional regulator with XRE-family HTH domain
MSVNPINQKLVALLALPHWTQTKVAERLGVSQSTVNRWTKGTAPEGDHRDALADLYNEVYGLTAANNMMPVRGRIVENQTVRWLDRPDQPWAAKPPTEFKMLTAIEVSGDSLLPFFINRSTIYYGDATEPSNGLGEIVVAELKDGRHAVRKLVRGRSENEWTLTIPSASDWTDVIVEAVHPIEWVKPYNWATVPF